MGALTLTPNQTLWLQALRSGTYQQGSGVLHDVTDSANPKFCCLGVAAQMFCPADVIPTSRHTDPTRINYDNCNAVAPWYVIDALNLRGSTGQPSDESSRLSLAGMNDGGMTFAEIADFFEANLAEYATNAS